MSRSDLRSGPDEELRSRSTGWDRRPRGYSRRRRSRCDLGLSPSEECRSGGAGRFERLVFSTRLRRCTVRSSCRSRGSRG